MNGGAAANRAEQPEMTVTKRLPPVFHAISSVSRRLLLCAAILCVSGGMEMASSMAEPLKLQFTHDGRIVVEDGRLLLTSILLSCEKQPNINEPAPNCRHYVACLDLKTKKPCFPSFAIHSVLSAQHPYDLKLVPGSQRVITFWAWAEGRPPGPDPAFKIYDFAGNQVRQFGMRDEFKDISPREFAVMGSGLVICTAGKRGGSNRGRLMVWNARTGELLQNTTTDYASLLEGSPDGRFVAVLIGHEIKVYSTI
jgi:hypothetical protein